MIHRSPASGSPRAIAAFGPPILSVATILGFAPRWALAEDAAAATQTVVVTAARVEQSLPDALPSTRVITREEIVESQALDLASVLRSLTSVDVAQTGPMGSQTSVFLRGADSRQTLLLVDGVPINRADFGLGSFQNLPLDQIERIEIVRGNVSSLYGSQAVGGVIQIFTRRATSPEASVSVAQRGTWSAAAAAGAHWGEGAQSTQLNASLSARGTEGYTARTVESGGNPDRDGASQQGLNLRLAQDWAAGQRTTLSLLSSRTRSDYDGFTPGLNDVLTTRLDVAGLSSRHTLAPALEFGLDIGSSNEHFDDPTGSAVSGRDRSQQGGVQLQWKGAPGQSLQAGVERKSERFSDSNTPDKKRDTDVVRLGWTAKNTAGLEWQADVRSDHSSDYGQATTGMLAVAYAFASQWKVSAQAGTAFNAPTFIDQEFASGPLMPERSRNAELALQWSRGGQLVRAALFAQRQTDRIEFDPVTFATANVARARNEGLELIAQLDAGPGRLSGELTLQDPRDADTGEPLKRRARQSLALNYRVTRGAWQWGAALRHTGERLDTDPITFSNAMNPPRTTLDLTTQWQINPVWTLGAKLENAGDASAPEVLGYTPPPRSFGVQLIARMP
jgi:vitamin B12 transporter